MTFPRKNYFFLFFVILGATVVHNSCNDSGCTNPDADNFDPEADKDDGSCIIYGCINPEADNFNADANTDDGTCISITTWYLDEDGDGLGFDSGGFFEIISCTKKFWIHFLKTI